MNALVAVSEDKVVAGFVCTMCAERLTCEKWLSAAAAKDLASNCPGVIG
ncbi:MULTISPECIES: hypothetical protein [unclassified Mesorhizobium]|nr:MULTISPECIES: hypothetical protein [unclassified Mesorhizobium]MBZ9717850.1 hypothetical protein [Mesorhizobium sp. AD1-1]